MKNKELERILSSTSEESRKRIQELTDRLEEREIKVGDRILIGGKHAAQEFYTNIVGEQATVTSIVGNHIRALTKSDLPLVWNINKEDCIPVP